MIRKIILLFLFLVLNRQWIYSQVNDLKQKQYLLNQKQINDSNNKKIETTKNEANSEFLNYNQFLAKDFLLFIGAGYATEGIINFEFKKLKEIYITKTINIIPPLTMGIEYALSDFFSLGSELSYFKYNPENFKNISLNLFLFKFRYVLHYNLSRLNLYLGSSLGSYILNTSINTNLFKLGNTGSLTYSVFSGVRIFFSDIFFIYVETAIPFPLVVGGFGFKL